MKGKYLIAKPKPEPKTEEPEEIEEIKPEPVKTKAKVKEIRIFGLKVLTSIQYMTELEV